MRGSRSWIPLVLALGIAPGSVAPAAAQAVPNPEFTEGQEQPTGWKLSGGQGRWVDRQLLEVTGTGEDQNHWACEVPVQPGGLYQFQMRARRTGGGGIAVSGTTYANHDDMVDGEWHWYGFVCRMPDQATRETLRLGQWHAPGTFQFDAVRFVPVVAVPMRAGQLLLGDDEVIADGSYRFEAMFDHPAGNYHRPLVSTSAHYNTTRWSFGPDEQVTYRFELPGHRFLAGEAGFNVNYYSSGVATVEVSRDGQTWLPLATRNALGESQATLPAELLPADTLWLRMRASKGDVGFQVDRLSFRAQLSDPPANASGKTCFAEQEAISPQLALEQLALEGDARSGQMRLHVAARNATEQATTVTLATTVQMPDGSPQERHHPTETVAAGAVATWKVPVTENGAGAHRVSLRLQPDQGQPLQYRCTVEAPDFYRSDYGRLLAQADGTRVWWCDATHKVPRQRIAPREASPAAGLSAAKNDFEAVQIVVQPERPLRGLHASCSALKHVGSAATIAANEIQILRVYYHRVEHPTDGVGLRDWWPDALPPLTEPIDVEAESNQPLWILVHVPTDAAAGDYAGEVTLQAENWSQRVPLRLHVWNFALPEKNHLETAFGFDLGMACRYHQVTAEADTRKLVDLYFRSFAEHRISVYNPTPLDPIGVRFVPQADPPRAEFDFAAFDRAMAEAIQRYHFTNFALPIRGMGGGTFVSRTEPAIEKFGEQTPQYQAMFASQVQQLQEHLREKGWLGMAYVYWFDEPEPKDYAFVRNGMERIKRHGPGIATMLTEEPNEGLDSAVDIFCPLSHMYDHAVAEKLRAQGTRFWWYVCTAPKAPYCTLFIDHPASELRVWHWQAWQRKISGTLVWQTNYWTSAEAFPEQPQNPYQDPMGYVSGAPTPRGAKLPWGNGDGRFVYPPLAAAVPGPAGSPPIFESPVSSIRFEMLREGIEDYEYLCLLRERLERKRAHLATEQVQRYEALLEVPASITKDITTFTTDPDPIYQRRAAIAAAIEQLSQ